ncbi:uncharacterized protein LOC128868386 [Anastrepha ludens]|uniref:uncharacterized protein LOC128868386 n=1 Tax=Anastrepha ludens TaxID=28586 RepID=UPI0023B1EF14|nr:uncharacterized protein LOC128868386 [Anastrepha ludens]
MQPQYVNYTQCKIEQVSRDVYEVTIAIALHLGPVNNITLSSSVVKRGYEDRQPMVDYKIDWCAFFHSKRRNILAKFFYSNMGLERYSNMNHSCPYDHDLLLDHYPFDGKAMGKVLPFGNGIFTFITKWYAYNILRAMVNIRFQTFES